MFKEKKQILLVVIVSLMLTLLTSLRTELMTREHPDFVKPWDNHKYIYMTENPFELQIAPFCWRILNPLLARMMPFTTDQNYLFIAFVSVWLSGFMVFALLSKFGLRFETSFLGTLLFYSNPWVTKGTLHLFFYPDALLMLVFLILIYFIVTNKNMLFIVTLSIGVLLKESVLFVVPLLYTLNARKFFDKISFQRTLIYCIPAVIILLTVRMLLPAKNSDSDYVRSLPELVSNIHQIDQRAEVEAGIVSKSIVIDPVRYDYKYMFETMLQYRIDNFSFVQFREMTVRTFGWFTMISVVWNLKKNISLFVRVAPLFVLSYIQIFFAFNTNRLIIIAFPALILLSMNGIQNAIDQYGIKPLYFYASISLMIILNLQTTLPIPFQYGTFWFVVSLAFSLFVLYKYFVLSKQTVKI